MSYSMV